MFYIYEIYDNSQKNELHAINGNKSSVTVFYIFSMQFIAETYINARMLFSCVTIYMI